MSAYPDHLMDHYRHPRNFTFHAVTYTHSSELDNPSCGDKIQVKALVSDGVVTTIAWEGIGCALSTASASIMTVAVTGTSVESILRLTKDDVLAHIDMEVTPVRLRCALIPLEAIQEALRKPI